MRTIANIAYFPILGKPLLLYLGILTFLSLLFTALIGYLNFREKTVIPFKWHPRMALTTICLATIHGLLGFLSYFF